MTCRNLCWRIVCESDCFDWTCSWTVNVSLDVVVTCFVCCRPQHWWTGAKHQHEGFRYNGCYAIAIALALLVLFCCYFRCRWYCCSVAAASAALLLRFSSAAGTAVVLLPLYCCVGGGVVHCREVGEEAGYWAVLKSLAAKERGI